MRPSHSVVAAVAVVVLATLYSAPARADLVSLSATSSAGKPVTIQFDLDFNNFQWWPQAVLAPDQTGEPAGYIDRAIAYGSADPFAFTVDEAGGKQWTAYGLGTTLLELDRIWQPDHAALHLSILASDSDLYYYDKSQLDLSYSCQGISACASFKEQWLNPSALTGYLPDSGAAYTDWTVPSSAHNPEGGAGQLLVRFSSSTVPEPDSTALFVCGALLLVGLRSTSAAARRRLPCQRHGRA